MCFILSDATSVSFLFLCPINFISTIKQKLPYLIWPSISIENTLVHTDSLHFWCAWNTIQHCISRHALLTASCNSLKGCKIIIFYQMVWEVISEGNSMDFSFGCCQHLHIPILCIAQDNGVTGVLDNSLSSRWQHCSAVFCFCFWLVFCFFANWNQFLHHQSHLPTKRWGEASNVPMLTDKAHIDFSSFGNSIIT